jgi:hypothetical protein
MNSTIDRTVTTSAEPIIPSVDSSPRRNAGRRGRSGVRRALGGLLAALMIGLAVGAVSNAEPAAAASGVGYCFKTKTGMYVAPATTYLEIYYNGRWNRVATGSTSWQSGGCGSFSMTGWYQNYYSKVVLSWRDTYSGNTFYGETPLMALPGSHYANLGTGTLSCYGGPCYGA